MHLSIRRPIAFILVLASFGLAFETKAQTSEDVAFSISATELLEVLATSDVTVLHVARDSADYRAGHVDGAGFLSLNEIAVSRDAQQRMLPSWEVLKEVFESAGISNDSRVVLYGEMNGLAATRAFFALDYTGHTKMSVLDGGYSAWQAVGGAVSMDDSPSPERGTYLVKLNQERVITASEIESLLGKVTMIDARSSAEYSGENPGNGIMRPGHIPGAISLDWQENLTEGGIMRPLSNLASKYAEAGERVIVYCRTGMKASYSYFVARSLGLDVALYDGSFSDWSNNTNFPVEEGE